MEVRDSHGAIKESNYNGPDKSDKRADPYNLFPSVICA